MIPGDSTSGGAAADFGRGPGAREEVLARIRQAHAAAVPEPWPYEHLTRDYRVPEAEQAAALDPPALTDLLAERVSDYRATVVRCGPDAVAAAVLGLLTERGSHRVVIPAGFGERAELAAETGIEWVVEEESEPLSVPTLDAVDAVVTGSAVAIALTGTLVLDASPDQGRRAITLVPDHHVCVVRAEDVVHGVGEALSRLETTRPLTWISGPSATSDIELNRVEGVHGPRVLDVVLVEPG